MNFKIAWLYYDLLELYGDRGNIKVLEQVLKENNINVEIDKITLNDERDLSNHDIIFLGGGSDSAQRLLYEDLIKRKEQIQKAMENNAFILTICGGYQMFGKYYRDASGEKIKGLEIFDYYTEGGKDRCIGNVIAKTTIDNEEITLVGFENHGGQTKDVKHPFATIVSGNGNEFESKYEGFMHENFIGTYLHGPLLPKNPEIAKYIIEYVLKNKYQNEQKIEITDLRFYKEAKDIVIKRG